MLAGTRLFTGSGRGLLNGSHGEEKESDWLRPRYYFATLPKATACPSDAFRSKIPHPARREQGVQWHIGRQHVGYGSYRLFLQNT